MVYFLLYLIPINFIFSIFINQHSFLNEHNIENDLNSNAIYEIVGLQDTIWLRTGSGISFISFDNSNNPLFQSMNDNNLPQGGSPAFIIDNDFIALSGASSTYQNNRYRPMGEGISWSIDKGHNWSYIEQPIDSVDTNYIWTDWGNQDSIRFKAITTTIYNVSYDIEKSNDYVYATSFAGGLRRFKYTNQDPEWELIPLPMDSQDSLICNQIDIVNYEYDPVDPPIGNDNHKAFSIFIDNSGGFQYIWVGTGDGINKGIIHPETNCIDWFHYNESDGMGDRWVIGIRNQILEDTNRLWAISWDPSLNTPIPHNLSYTEDEGQTWNFISFFKEIGAIVYDLNFDDNDIYASTDLGLYRTYNGNLNVWFLYDIQDSNNQTIMTDVIYSSSINALNNQYTLWAGSPDGLFYSSDDGYSWDMYRTWNKTENSKDDDKRLSAYPNPFYIDETSDRLRIVYYNGSNNHAELDIFNFSMQHIVKLKNPVIIGDEGEFIWDGKNHFYQYVSNGVYLCRLTLGSDVYWTKLMVIHS